MKPAKCPFYPDSCTVEFHPNMQHVWRADTIDVLRADGSVELWTEDVAKASSTAELSAHVAKRITNAMPRVTNKASERAQAWNKANGETYNARQKTLMQARRGKRGG